MPDKISKRRCFARMQFRAIKTLVEQKIEQGYSIKLLFEELTEAGNISMAYTTFCDYIRGKGDRQHGKKKAGSKPGINRPSNQAASKPAVKIDKSTPFAVEKARLEDLI